jgi:hypothetical protein
VVHAGAQLRSADREARRAKLEALYNDFITEAARIFVDALSRQTEDPTKMVTLYALASRMRLVSARAVTDAAIRIEDNILETYLGPNRTLHEARDLVCEGGMKNLLIEFGEACRDDLAGHAR